MPLIFNMVTLSILAPTLLDYGSEEQKQQRRISILRGENLGPVLSEPHERLRPAGCAHPGLLTASGCSTVPRSGAPGRTAPKCADVTWPAPTGTCPSTPN